MCAAWVAVVVVPTSISTTESFVNWKYDALCVCVSLTICMAHRYRSASSETTWNVRHTLDAGCSIQLFKFISMRIFDLICSVLGKSSINSIWHLFLFFSSLSLSFFCSFISLHIENRIDDQENRASICVPLCRSYQTRYFTSHSPRNAILFIWFFVVCFYCSWFKFYYHPFLLSAFSLFFSACVYNFEVFSCKILDECTKQTLFCLSVFSSMNALIGLIWNGFSLRVSVIITSIFITLETR